MACVVTKLYDRLCLNEAGIISIKVWRYVKLSKYIEISSILYFKLRNIIYSVNRLKFSL